MKNIFTATLFLTFLFLSSLSSAQTDSQFVHLKFEKVSADNKFPEGPAWDGKGALFTSNCYGNWITRIKTEKTDTFVTAPTQPYSFEKTNGLVFFEDGSLYACEYGKGAIIKFDKSGKCRAVTEGYNGIKFNRPNDLAFDGRGKLYFTDPKSYDKNIPDGVVYFYDLKTQKTSQAFKGLTFPNGIAFSSDRKFVFVCESAQERVLRFPVKSDGTLGEYTVFAHIPGGDPDGIAFDIQGNLYVAHFGGGKICVFSPSGVLRYMIKTPGKKPSNLEFADKDMRTLYVTEDETNAVYKTRVDIPGLRLFNAPVPKIKK